MFARRRLSHFAICASAVALVAAAGTAHAEPVKKVAADREVADREVRAGAKSSSARKTTAGAAKARTLGAFTPSTLDGVKHTTASGATVSSERTFRFTPSGKVGDRKALSVGVTSRVVRAGTAKVARPARAGAVTAYNVGVAVAYLGFAVNGGVSKLDSVIAPGRAGVDLGLSYRGKRWKTAIQLNADRAVSGARNPLQSDKRYSVELGGAYALNARMSVLGGVRYQMIEPDQLGSAFLKANGLSKGDSEIGSVYLGTSISF